MSAATLRAWREPPALRLAQRNLGLAYLEVGRRKGRPDYLDEGASLPAQLLQTSREQDPLLLNALGSVLILKQAPPEAGFKQLAVDLLEDAVSREPRNARHYRTLASAYRQLRNRHK